MKGQGETPQDQGQNFCPKTKDCFRISAVAYNYARSVVAEQYEKSRSLGPSEV